MKIDIFNGKETEVEKLTPENSKINFEFISEEKSCDFKIKGFVTLDSYQNTNKELSYLVFVIASLLIGFKGMKSLLKKFEDNQEECKYVILIILNLNSMLT